MALKATFCIKYIGIISCVTRQWMLEKHCSGHAINIAHFVQMTEGTKPTDTWRRHGYLQECLFLFKVFANHRSHMIGFRVRAQFVSPTTPVFLPLVFLLQAFQHAAYLWVKKVRGKKAWVFLLKEGQNQGNKNSPHMSYFIWQLFQNAHCKYKVKIANSLLSPSPGAKPEGASLQPKIFSDKAWSESKMVQVSASPYLAVTCFTCSWSGTILETPSLKKKSYVYIGGCFQLEPDIIKAMRLLTLFPTTEII